MSLEDDLRAMLESEEYRKTNFGQTKISKNSSIDQVESNAQPISQEEYIKSLQQEYSGYSQVGTPEFTAGEAAWDMLGTAIWNFASEAAIGIPDVAEEYDCLLYTSPIPRD